MTPSGIAFPRRTGVLLIFAMVAALLGACSTAPRGLPDRSSAVERPIVLVHPYSGETVAATYRRGSVYDAGTFAAIARLMRDRRTGEAIPIDPGLIDFLADLRDGLGLAPDTPIHMISGYRSPVTNAALARTDRNVARNSYHMRGMAMDIRIPGVPSGRIAAFARSLRRGGTSYYPASDHVHIDTGPVRTW